MRSSDSIAYLRPTAGSHTPGSRLPAPGSRLPAPGSRLPAPAWLAQVWTLGNRSTVFSPWKAAWLCIPVLLISATQQTIPGFFVFPGRGRASSRRGSGSVSARRGNTQVCHEAGEAGVAVVPRVRVTHKEGEWQRYEWNAVRHLHGGGCDPRPDHES
ncbi:hypothetical protein GCM10010387_01290 [Streptomyces inusitatus]|uniref:Uncharacterized protein n=1 Tax=Streptomyces inusitatus TaxID=68221 RepID=A0A918PLM0_9ACTN|nr:hypothetical protein GCM10010387_01290 [Streptomyces inusitatus]